MQFLQILPDNFSDNEGECQDQDGSDGQSLCDLSFLLLRSVRHGQPLSVCLRMFAFYYGVLDAQSRLVGMFMD